MARFLHRVRLENYKSIARCDVELQDVTFLVGPNGAGKSNFLDALEFLGGATAGLLSRELSTRGGVDSLIRRGASSLTIAIEATQARYAATLLRGSPLQVGEEFEAADGVRYTLQAGKLEVKGAGRSARLDHLASSTNPHDDLVLAEWMEIEEVGELARPLASCRFFAFIPDHYRNPEPVLKDAELARDGRYLASVLRNLQTESPDDLARIDQYLQVIVPDLQRVSVLTAGGYDILQFEMAGENTPFNASQVSDGTLHALAILTALFDARRTGVALVGIEEPETGLHPAAIRAIRDAMVEIGRDVQIVVTSHSPDLLDSPEISADSVLAVVRENGETRVGPLDAASRKSLEQHLFTAGELLHLDQLEPAAEAR